MQVKSGTFKNKFRQAKFAAIGCPPQLVTTRWESWLNAALYSAKKLHEVKAIVRSFEGSGILVTQAKVSLQTTGLATQLLKIKDQYKCPVKLRKTTESAKYNIKEVVQAIHKLDFREDNYSTNCDIKKKMQNHNILKIMNMKKPDISPDLII